MERQKLKKRVRQLYPEHLLSERGLGYAIHFAKGKIILEEKDTNPEKVYVISRYNGLLLDGYNTRDSFEDALEAAESALVQKLKRNKRKYVGQFPQASNQNALRIQLNRITKTLAQINERYE